MKNNIKKISISVLFFLTSLFLFVFLGCEQIQSTLSSTQKELVQLATGFASVESTVLFYNGMASEDITDQLSSTSPIFTEHTLELNFGKKIALDQLAGSIQLEYQDENSHASTKRFTSLKGSFGEKYTSYNIMLNEIFSLFDSVHIPSGTAIFDLKVQGFMSAEENQNGRPIQSFSEKFTVKPLYKNTSIDYSTCWYKEGDVISIPLNTSISLFDVPNPYIVTDTNEGISFYVSSGNENLILKPLKSLYGLDNKALKIPISGIRSPGSGTSFNKTFDITLVNSAIVIDGFKDSNFSSEYATRVADTQGDQGALGYTTNMGDIHEINIVNDDTYLYIGLSGDLHVTWNDGIILMISKDSTDATYASYKPSETFTVVSAGGKPTVYLYHQPGINNTGEGLLGCYTSTTDISSFVKVAPKGWTDSTTGNFTEYAIPLAKAGINTNDTVKIIACLTLVWGEGRAVCDIVPNLSISKYEEEGKNVRVDFAQAISYTVQ